MPQNAITSAATSHFSSSQTLCLTQRSPTCCNVVTSSPGKRVKPACSIVCTLRQTISWGTSTFQSMQEVSGWDWGSWFYCTVCVSGWDWGSWFYCTVCVSVRDWGSWFYCTVCVSGWDWGSWFYCTVCVGGWDWGSWLGLG